MGKEKKVAVGRVFKPTGERLENGFDGVWKGYEFDEYEIDYLLQGEEIWIESINGNNVPGRLEKIRNEYLFRLTVPEVIASYELSKEERKALMNGESLIIDKFWDPKKCERFAASISWNGENIIMKIAE